MLCHITFLRCRYLLNLLLLYLPIIYLPLRLSIYVTPRAHVPRYMNPYHIISRLYVLSVSTEMTAFRKRQFANLCSLFSKPVSSLRVLEIGAGDGQYSSLLSEFFPNVMRLKKMPQIIVLPPFTSLIIRR